METNDPLEEASRLWGEQRYEELIAFLGPYAETGAGWAYSQLGVCFQLGLGVERDVSISRHYLELAGRTGDEPAPLPFAKMIFLHSRDRESCARVRELLEVQANEGDPAAARLLAETYLVGESSPSDGDLQMAERYLRISAGAADPEAMHRLGYLYEMPGRLQDADQARFWYVKAVDLGNPESAHNLARRYESDRDSDDSQRAARHYYEIAAAAGVPLAQHNLAAMYYDGRGGSVDYDRSYQMYLAATQQGSYLSAFNIALLIRDGLVAVEGDQQAQQLVWMLVALAQARANDVADPTLASRVEDAYTALTDAARSAARQLLQDPLEIPQSWSAGAIEELDKLDGVSGGDGAAPQRSVDSSYAEQMRVRTDLKTLPEETNRFLDRLDDLDFTVAQKHGLFVLVGLIAGVARPKEEIVERQRHLQEVIPTDTEVHIDKVVGDFYPGYETVLEEWIARTGNQIQFRDIVVDGLADPLHALKPKIHNVIDTTSTEISGLASAASLFDGFLQALGEPTCNASRTFKESFLCGVFQMQLLAQSDVSASQQLGVSLEGYPPLVLGQCLRSINGNNLAYLNSAEPEQIALLPLMSRDNDYAQLFWGFQSSLLFEDGQRLDLAGMWDVEQWHSWVVDQSTLFAAKYKDRLLPFSRSGHQLEGLPSWAGEISKFDVCDQYIEAVWGYSGKSITKRRDVLEYKALVAHTVYSSLTASLERMQ